MTRNTLLCVLAVLAFGQGQAGHSQSTSASLHQTSPPVTSGSGPTTTISSFSAGSPASTGSSVSGTTASSAPGPSSTSAGPSSSPSATATMSPSPSPKVSSSHNSVSQSATTSASAFATPSLSSSKFKSSTVVVHSSSPLPSPSTSEKSFFSPSPTVVAVTETVNITDDKNEPCLQARVEVTFDVKYKAINETKKESAKIPLNGKNKTLNVTGECSYETGRAHFTMTWNERGNLSVPHTFTMNFELENTTWSVPNVTATFSTSDRDAFIEKAVKSSITTSGNGTMFGTRKNGTNYLCDAESTLKMSNGVTAMFQNVVLQPFSKKTALDTSGPHCSADESESDDNTVPIAVGAALGGLVLIVLVAYIIGRRRSNRGYEQV